MKQIGRPTLALHQESNVKGLVANLPYHCTVSL